MRILSGSPSYPNDHGSLGEAGTGPSSYVSLRMLFEEFPFLCARVVRTRNLVHYFRCPCFWQSLFSGVWVLLRCSEKWIFREMSISVGGNAWSNSGYMLCVSTGVALDVFHTFSTLRQTRILKCCSPFCCRTEKRAQSMLLVAVLLCAVRTWKTGQYFYELHVADTSDDGENFSPLSAAFFGLLLGIEARWYGAMPIHLDILWSYILSQSTRQKQQQQPQQPQPFGSRFMPQGQMVACPLVVNGVELVSSRF